MTPGQKYMAAHQEYLAAEAVAERVAERLVAQGAEHELGQLKRMSTMERVVLMQRERGR